MDWRWSGGVGTAKGVPFRHGVQGALAGDEVGCPKKQPVTNASAVRSPCLVDGQRGRAAMGGFGMAPSLAVP
jgi:hypothetical protein